jgi:hypothetical protein
MLVLGEEGGRPRPFPSTRFNVYNRYTTGEGKAGWLAAPRQLALIWLKHPPAEPFEFLRAARESSVCQRDPLLP